MKTIIREAKEINSLINAFAKKNPNINPKDLERLFTADPTTVQNSRGVFAGKYCVWIGNQYVNGKLKVGDIPELKKALNTYNINKSQITTPINNIGSLSDLITIISDYTDDFKATRQLSKGEQALEKVYEDAEWVVYIPHTYEASRKIGGDTNWCTASSDDRYFNMYTKEGPLYVNIRKSDGAKFQFHFPTRQFMDSKDKRIISENIGLSKGLIKFYNNIDPLFFLYMQYDYVGDFFNGYAIVRINNKYNLINIQGKLVSPKQWFDNINNFYKKYARVRLNSQWNFMDTQGKLMSPGQWFDWVGHFSGRYATVELNGAWNYIDTRGRLISPNLWFDDADSFYRGYATVELNGKRFKIDTKGNIMTAVNEHTVTITKSDLRKIVLECVKKIMNIS